MSNRRVLGALSILLLACLFMAIGCGDGKRNSKSNPRKAFAGGKVGGDQKSLQEKATRLKAVDDAARAVIDAGQTIDKNNLEAGTYTLDEVMGYVKFMRNQDELYSLAINKVNAGALGQPVGNPLSEGAMGKDSDEQRLVEIPRSFTVAGMGNIQSPAIAQNVIYAAQVGMDGKMMQSLNEPGTATEISLLNRILSTQAGSNGVFTANLNGGKKLEILIKRVDGGVRFIVLVHEMKKADKGRRDATLLKHMVFTYKLQRAAAGTGLPTGQPGHEGEPPLPPPQQQQGPAVQPQPGPLPAAPAPAPTPDFQIDPNFGAAPASGPGPAPLQAPSQNETE